MTATDIAGTTSSIVGGEALTGIDHVVIGVNDLDGARDSFARLGFTVSPRGRHVGWGTANYTVMFENDYLNLMSIVDPTQDLNRLDQFLEAGEATTMSQLARGTRNCFGGSDTPFPSGASSLLRCYLIFSRTYATVSWVRAVHGSLAG